MWAGSSGCRWVLRQRWYRIVVDEAGWTGLWVSDVVALGPLGIGMAMVPHPGGGLAAERKRFDDEEVGRDAVVAGGLLGRKVADGPGCVVHGGVDEVSEAWWRRRCGRWVGVETIGRRGVGILEGGEMLCEGARPCSVGEHGCGVSSGRVGYRRREGKMDTSDDLEALVGVGGVRSVAGLRVAISDVCKFFAPDGVGDRPTVGPKPRWKEHVVCVCRAARDWRPEGAWVTSRLAERLHALQVP